jgi:aldose 1-epimerase
LYSIKNLEENTNSIICIENKNKSTFAKIYVNLGASLQELKLQGKTIIEDLHPLTYNNTYASSILFPFVNRIKDGTYNFEGKTYQFQINEIDRNNAIHGLVYNKTFQVIDQKTSEDFASVKLLYTEENESVGFPYTYAFQVEYILKDDALDIHVEVTNTDSKPFPFNIGWHPYFISKDLHNSYLKFDCNKKTTFNERCITDGVIDNDVDSNSGFKIEDRKLDDCYILNSGNTLFTTPEYTLEIKASSKENFLQIYMPPRANTVAIEPTTGVADSFNNKMGLQTLKPNEIHRVTWNVNML